MTILSDRSIVDAVQFGRVTVDPFDDRLLQPASIDVRLDSQLLVPRAGIDRLDLHRIDNDLMIHVDMDDEDGWELPPGGFVLGCTAETIGCGPMHAARVEGKSSLARLGLQVHITGGFIDPGFRGQVTLEIVNLAPWSFPLTRHMRIGQVAFHQLDQMPFRLYGERGHYQGQVGPTASRYQLDTPAHA